jgi:hypothetical protein
MATGEGPLRQALSARLAAVPGVTHVGVATVAPIIDSQSSVAVMRPDAEYDATGGLRRAAVIAFVDREYFEVLRLPIAEGRSLSDADFVRADGETPAVISSALANALWPAGDALGERFVGGTLSLRVVGVTAPVAVRSVRDADATALWLPIANSGRASTDVLVRTAAGRGPSAAAIRGALAPFAGEFMVRRIRPLEGGIATSLEDTTLAAEVTLVLGGAALVMAAVGLFGVVSSQVARRRREFGVRIALGASPRSVVRGVLASAVSVAAAGAATGYGTLVVLEPQLRPLLFRTEALDVSVAAVVAGGLLAVTIAAAWLPARRAAESDPLVVLRSE